MRDVAGYVSSYTVCNEKGELFRLDLVKQAGFYQISEFTGTNDSDNFIIEQTNRAGSPKVSAFDKSSGSMLGSLKSNDMLDSEDNVVFRLHSFSNTHHQALMQEFDADEEDFVAISKERSEPFALFITLPKKHPAKSGIFSRIKSMASNITHPHDEIMQVIILDKNAYDERMMYTIAVILHDRGGLQIN